MPWARIRKATDEDRARLELAAALFVKMHKLESYTRYAAQATDPRFSVSFALERALNRWSDLYKSDSALHQRLTDLWRAEAGHALREEDASGIIDGYVVGFKKP
jgi:hypothetical protein